MPETLFRQLTPDDMDQLLDLRSVAYQPIDDRPGHAEAFAWRLPHGLGAFYGGRLRSVTFMYRFGAYLGGREVKIGSLSSVATAPEARRRGLVAAGLRRWYAALREEGVAWSAEHPFEPTFYAKLGYQTVQNGHTLELPLHQLRTSAGERGAARPVDAEPVGPGSIDRLKPIHTAFARRFSFDLSRAEGVKDHWRQIFRRPWEDVDQFGYLLEDAYAILTTEDEPDADERSKLRVRDYAYSSPAGRRRLFDLLASFEGQVELVRIHLPPGDPVALDRAAYGTAKAPELQLRIVDLEAALAGQSWPEPASLTLRVEDPDCPWNDGVFELELAAHGATVQRSNAEPDAALSVRALVSLVTGAATPGSLVSDGLAEGSAAALNPLSRALSGHPVFKPHADHF